MKKLVLASSSPRRAELLRQIGLNFEIITSDVDETLLPGLSPPEQVEYLARKKAEAVAREVNSGIDGIVIAADTIVVWQEQILGKPLDGEEAFAILSRLQGSAHDVFTGIALVDTHTGGVLTGHEQTRVFLRAIEEDEIRRYIDSGEPLDKAGAYGVQGLAAIFIERLEGCYTNVVGLPLARLSLMFKKFGFNVL
ncbi:MAG: septum formation inhibitor Maf [Peptococcaceae bacterium]|nr:septum formation inhibitor Maf [Candidatus Syntrophopropionicum ammoniitolerans]